MGIKLNLVQMSGTGLKQNLTGSSFFEVSTSILEHSINIYSFDFYTVLEYILENIVYLK